MSKKEILSFGEPDPRSAIEITEDIFDRELADLYLDFGLIGADENVAFNRDQALRLIRAGVARGLLMARGNSEAYKQFIGEIDEAGKNTARKTDT